MENWPQFVQSGKFEIKKQIVKLGLMMHVAVFLSSACSLLFVKLQTVGTLCSSTRRQADEQPARKVGQRQAGDEALKASVVHRSKSSLPQEEIVLLQLLPPLIN